jgi:hypothetical protein
MSGTARKDKAVNLSVPKVALLVFLALGLAVTGLAWARPGLGQVPPPPGGAPPGPSLKVFLDWPGADLAYFGGEIPFAEFVSSLDAAQVHVRVSLSPPEGSGALTLDFAGLKEFAGDDNTLRYRPKPGEKPEESRSEVARLIKIGLIRYVAKTPAAKLVSVEFMDQVKPTSVIDKWDFWVFNLGSDMFMDGETQYSDTMFSGNLSANRVTPELKIRTSVYGNLYRQRFDIEGESIKSSSQSYGFEGLVVKSLGEHWSVGGYLSAASSTYSNTKFSASAAPALEYDVFPYSESTKRQLRILYRLGYTQARYRELTVYDRMSQGLFRESLSVTLELKRPWGNVTAGLEGSHYFFKPFKYQVALRGEISFRIWRGLNFEVDGSFAKIHDQMTLPKAGATPEEILLMLRELETDFSYYFSVGLNFRFGSLKSNVVNPRFGSGSRSVSISF